MILSIGKWRWPVIVGLPILVGVVLALGGVGRLRYDGKAVLGFTGDPTGIDQELKIFQSEITRKKINATIAKVPGHALEVDIQSHGAWPSDVLNELKMASQACIDKAFARQKADIQKELDGLQQKQLDLETRLNLLAQERNAFVSIPKPELSRSDAAAQIRKLKVRRQLLIERFPTHTDIPLLAKKIQELQSQLHGKSSAFSEKIVDLDRQMIESKVRLDYFSRLLQGAVQRQHALKPAWKVILPAQKPTRPTRVEGWPLCAGILIGLFTLGLILTRTGSSPRKEAAANGLWKPEGTASPVELKVVAPEPVSMVSAASEETLPSDPLTQKAAELYTKWVEVAKVLYAPSPEAPQGIIDSVGPLLQESTEFLPEGHDVLARYLARRVTAGDLPAHVARTVLMTLTGAQDAGVSPEHCLAMALAALFHDLAVVPRPPSLQEEVGSDIGRLSASVLRRIPGLQPALLSMVEEILVGMDEFKLETWQNVANGTNLEPLSKVIREIDRFEKVMQKQRSRLDRQITQQKAS